MYYKAHFPIIMAVIKTQLKVQKLHPNHGAHHHSDEAFKLTFEYRVAKYVTYGRYVRVKILEGWGKKYEGIPMFWG